MNNRPATGALPGAAAQALPVRMDNEKQSAGTPLLQRHTFYEDVQALLTGTLLVSLGVALLGKAQLITGGTVGIAFLLHYMSGISFGKLFFAINLPFYFLAVKKMGWKFTLKTFAAVFLLSAFSEMLPNVVTLSGLHPLYGGIMGGLLCGIGLLALFRHRASLGGVNVLVLYLQERYGLRAGLVQLGLDAAIMLLSVPMISLTSVLVSLVGAAVMNLALAINHKPGRYMAI
ncbi:MAG TPA: YitT family protein [Noviherbaspirillum sp.]|uniref:YitT family protein n=1 Tax=Noviherbaspirillum sp. TaxID=1926288 RepID=UPI002D3C508B|nr:YitT family protein [Noviherbaspirillum sp.]HYD95944.1 YitT family protein [Noviherbaspirillum sp.]